MQCPSNAPSVNYKILTCILCAVFTVEGRWFTSMVWITHNSTFSLYLNRILLLCGHSTDMGKTRTVGHLSREQFPVACIVMTDMALYPAVCASHFLVLHLVHMNNEAPGIASWGYICGCEQEGLVPAENNSSYWLETDMKQCRIQCR